MNANKLGITRRSAIKSAILLLEKQKRSEEEIKMLELIAEEPVVVKWTNVLLEDCVNDFYLDNDRLPTVTDLESDEKLPSHTNFKYLFGVTAREWLGKKVENFIPPKISRRKALFSAIGVLKGKEKKKVQEILDEYPIAKWNAINVVDCIITYYEKYSVVPSQKQFEKSNALPYYGIFKYKWGTGYLKWLKINIPYLYEKYVENNTRKKDYVLVFSSEYRRVRPKSEDDFDAKRNVLVCPKACCVAKSVGVKGWKKLVEYCGLEPYDFEFARRDKERKKIKSIRIINVDCGENLFFREYSKKLEREVIM